MEEAILLKRDRKGSGYWLMVDSCSNVPGQVKQFFN